MPSSFNQDIIKTQLTKCYRNILETDNQISFDDLVYDCFQIENEHD